MMQTRLLSSDSISGQSPTGASASNANVNQMSNSIPNNTNVNLTAVNNPNNNNVNNNLYNVQGRARTKAFSVSSEDGDSVHVIERREEYLVNPRESYFCEDRHLTNGTPANFPAILGSTPNSDDWRMKERMKTVSAVLVLCLNIGVDPPDVIKTSPCAKLECWVDPYGQPTAKALETIGNNLQSQYEKWQPKARYKLCLDPTVEDVKKTCIALRKNAKDERILFHYNGHGVPKPTSNGEVWVFNKNFTQYIPLSIYDLQSWMGSPSIFVYDCSAAGHIVAAFNSFADQREREYERIHLSNPNQFVQPMRDCIQLAACRKDQVLPMNPDLPADLFSSCLTTPIDIALRWFILQNSLLSNISMEIIDKIPGRLNDRRTPLGELNWIFTAITDTIAWNVLPKDLFQKLFRQDLLVASLFRNFLLAERVMRTYNCTPISSPPLPQTHQHPLWQAWDLAVDSFLTQFVGEVAPESNTDTFEHSTFFNEQLTAFEVWLEHASEHKKPPAQLPVVLQVLLSQNHRLRALQLLAKFLEFGPWAVNLALSVGLFPYVLKLLQSPATELRKLLVHIWAKIICVDRTCQTDLIKDNGYKYFVHVIWNPPVKSDERAMAACVLACICTSFKAGQQACYKGGTISHCLTHLNDPDPFQRQWLCLCLAELWAGYGEAKSAAYREGAHEKLQVLLTDPVPEVRAAAIYALGKLFGDVDKTDEITSYETNMTIALVLTTSDASPLVRKELIVALSLIVKNNESEFRTTAAELWDEEQRRAASNEKPEKRASLPVILPSRAPNAAPPHRDRIPSFHGNVPPNPSIFQVIWKVLLNLSVDPFPEVCLLAQTVVDAVNIYVINVQPTAAQSPANNKAPPVQPANKKNAASLKSLLTLSPSTESLTSGGSSSSLSKKLRPPPKLPLESTYFEWCIEYFNKPISEKIQLNDPGSAKFQEQLWKTRRNETIIKESKNTLKNAAQKKFDDQIAFLENETEFITLLQFHPFENHLIAADEKGYVHVWDINESRRIKRFFNENPSNVRVTSLEIINPKDTSLLLLGSDDGVIRIWKDYETRSEIKQVTTWRALTDLLPISRGSGLVSEWMQDHATLVVSGDVRVIRIWDAVKELCVQDLPTHSDSCVTSLTSNKQQGHMIIAGCGDGSVRVYDRRSPNRDGMVMQLTEHKGWVVKCQLQQGGNGDLISGSHQGDIRFWDLRLGQSVKLIDAQGNMSALAIHDRAPLLASGSNHQYIKVFNTDGDALNMIRYHDGFLGQRIGPISCATFHPYKLLLAAGSTDSIVSVFA